MSEHHHRLPTLAPEKNGNHSSNKTAFNELTVNQLKTILRAKGFPVSGKKAELINRLELSEYDGRGARTNSIPKQQPKPWQHSTAKKELKRALLDPTSNVHSISVEEVHRSNDQYKLYPNFPKYYRALQLHIEEEKMQVIADDIAAADQMKQNPRHRLNKRGYPHWDTHIAKILLERDIANKVHEKMSPQQLRMTRDAYKEFPPRVFGQQVQAEKTKQRAAKFWALKRNKEGLIRHMNKLTL